MRYVQLGEDRVSVIGLGTWQYGAKVEWGWKASQREQAIAIIRRALELGVNLIDTAEAYSRGESERIIGEAIADRRDQVFLATKHNPLLPPLSGRILKTARASLDRLGVESVDLYQMHWPNPSVPWKTQMKGMRAVLQSTWTKHLGVSNFSLGQWQKAEKALGGPIATNQVPYNLLQRKADRMLPWAKQNGRLIIAYSPLAQGLLSGKYHSKNRPGGFRKINSLYTRSNLKSAQPVIDLLCQLASKYSATPSQLALAWLVHHPNVVAIPGAKTLQQLEQNVAAADIQLEQGDFEALTQTSDAFKKSSPITAFPQVIGRFLSRSVGGPESQVFQAETQHGS